MKKIIFGLIWVAVTIVFLFSCTANTTNELKHITGYYSKNEISTFWDVTALAYAGEDMSAYNITPFLSAELPEDDYGALSGRIIGLKMLEKSGYDISSQNLDFLISRLEELTKKDDAEGYALPALQRLYGIYALKISDADYSEDNIKSFASHLINTYKLEDGGFSTFSKSSSDIDTTAFILPLLCYLDDDKAFADAAKGASNFIKRSKNKNDTYSSFGTENSNSTASALSALIAAGYTREDDDILNISLALSTFRLANGGYSYKLYSEATPLSSAQALITFCDLANQSSLWLSILEEKI
ncbi:MAG: hypothetical protein IJO52_07915 [Clostridia bacterium]|nr:hypothetical protein [Clostridia bacterium]